MTETQARIGLNRIRIEYEALLWQRMEDIEKHVKSGTLASFKRRERELEQESNYLKKKLGISLDGEAYLCLECRKMMGAGNRTTHPELYQLLEFGKCADHEGLTCL